MISSNAVLFLFMIGYVTIVPLMPRFIISIRELYDRDVRHGWKGVDSGFGVSSQPVDSENGVVSGIAFADVRINPGWEGGQTAAGDEDKPEENVFEMLRNGSAQQV